MLGTDGGFPSCGLTLASGLQIPLAIPFIGESGWIMWQHVILTLRHKNGAVRMERVVLA